MRSLVLKKFLASFLVAFLTILVYLPALKNDFVNWDDDVYVYENAAIRTPDVRAHAWMFTSYRAGNWHPLTWISHGLDYALWGLNPAGHHLTSMILHGLNVMLIFLLVVRLFYCERRSRGAAAAGPVRAIPAAVVAALLFGLHPLRVESVVWVSERKDLLCACFVLIAILIYLSYAVERTGRKRSFLFMASIVCSALALMSKPMAVSLPLVLFLIDVYPLRRVGGGRGRWSMILLEKIPFAVMSMMSGIITLRAQASAQAIGSFDALPLATRLLNGAHTLVFYLQKTFVPVGLSPFYPYPVDIRWSEFRYFVSVILVTAITALCFWLSSRGRHLLSSAWFYYVVTLLPVIGIVQVGSQAAADRYTYLPSVGIFILVGLGVVRLWDAAFLKQYALLKKGCILLLLGCVLFALGMLTIKQIGVWRTSGRLWEYVIAHAPIKIPVAYNNLGIVLARAGRLEEAVEAYKQALAVKPDYANARNNLGNAYFKSGDVDAAIVEYTRVLAHAPQHAGARYNLGNAYREKGLLDQAVIEYEKALAINPDYTKARRNLMEVLRQKREQDQKMLNYERSLSLNPADAVLHNAVGQLYGSKGMVEKAIFHYRQAIAIKPDYAAAYNNLAWVYATSVQEAHRNGQEAVWLATKACQLTGFQNAGMLDTLAAAFAETGDFKSAVFYQEKALTMSHEKEHTSLRARLRRYQSGQAYRSY